ncbi:hypothetical protein, partial [Psychrobacter piscatorii]|uniref:hypothetical protein n=1 Tax=Psychrobacter piscatorii TaxID=554343 RepID=UPI0031DB1829
MTTIRALDSHLMIAKVAVVKDLTGNTNRLTLNRPEIVGDSTLQENTTMKTRKYTPEMKERAVRML